MPSTLTFRQNEFVCKSCGEIKNHSQYVPDRDKYCYNPETKRIEGVITCGDCKKRIREELAKQTSEVLHNGKVSEPRSITSRLRDKAARRENEAIQDAWASFKAAYKSADLDIITSSKYFEESAIPSEIMEMDHENLDSEIHDLMIRLNNLRSRKFHLLRRAAYEKRISIQEAMNEERVRRRQARSEKGRKQYLASLKGDKKAFKKQKMTPAEAKEFFKELGIDVDALLKMTKS